MDKKTGTHDQLHYHGTYAHKHALFGPAWAPGHLHQASGIYELATFPATRESGQKTPRVQA